MTEKRKIGIMGGTFNPVHIAHMILAENAYRQFELDRVVFLPSGEPPHKAGRHIASAADRLAMVQAAVKDIPYFTVSDLELLRSGYSYTADTLGQLRREHPDADYYFILGGDSLFHIEKWHEPALVMANCVILAAIRDNARMQDFIRQADHLKSVYDADIRIMDLPDIELSSSEIRLRRRRGQSIRFMVPEGVYTYIMEHDLYRKVYLDAETDS